MSVDRQVFGGYKVFYPCLTGGWIKLGIVMSGNSARSKSYSLVELEIASRWGSGVAVVLNGVDW